MGGDNQFLISPWSFPSTDQVYLSVCLSIYLSTYLPKIHSSKNHSSLRFHKPLKCTKIVQGSQAVILYSLLIVFRETISYKINEYKIYL